MRYSRVVGMATSGVATRSCHTHFHDVNPLKRHQLTREERWTEHVQWEKSARASKARQREIFSKGGRLLPSLV